MTSITKLTRSRSVCIAESIGIFSSIAASVLTVILLSIGNSNAEPVKTIDWGDDLNSLDLTKQIDQDFTLTCPRGKTNDVWIFGTDIYGQLSRICIAAVHAGAITKNGGTFTIRIKPGEDMYNGLLQNGVDSNSYSGMEASFIFIKNGQPFPLKGSIGGIKIIQDIDISSLSLNKQIDRDFTFICLSGIKPNSYWLWGTDIYNNQSRICTAAIHAGAITRNGGKITIRIKPVEDRYSGSIRYGVESHSTSSSSDSSFIFIKNDPSSK